ncbi:unnamed protein product [Hyaloperonospora brassicae]|uniref:RxLR effector candidate protein n=1 Tax=Hyaloperonospora brassicae TaxID=162125 RepID=A0AAV0US74_HYABA|nr:unnamed protein product [Hyaloperonospora brassicae]
MDTLPAHWVWPPLDAPEERRDGTMTKRKFMALFELLFWFNLKNIRGEERINPAWKVSWVVSRKRDTIAEKDGEME